MAYALYIDSLQPRHGEELNVSLHIVAALLEEGRDAPFHVIIALL